MQYKKNSRLGLGSFLKLLKLGSARLASLKTRLGSAQLGSPKSRLGGNTKLLYQDFIILVGSAQAQAVSVVGKSVYAKIYIHKKLILS